MPDFSWLHFTDLDLGLEAQGWLWPNVREVLLADLEDLHARCGPWDVVLFTGDLTQHGTSAEFARLNETLQVLWDHFRALGSTPALIAVPGNHDLIRPDQRCPEARILGRWDLFPEAQKEFWGDPSSPYRELIEQVFEPYTEWLKSHPFCSLPLQRGMLPGDCSTVLTKDGFTFGIVGLNSAFLQLGDGNYLGRLALDVRQFHAACGGDGPAWCKECDFALLMTHHPPNWLQAKARDGLAAEIAPPGRFVAHLFGNMHEGAATVLAAGGAQARRELQGRSLFGLEVFGDGRVDRRHGYAAARITVNDKSEAALRLWPRAAKRHAAGHWRITQDLDSFELNDDQGTRPEPLPSPRRARTSQTATTPSPSGAQAMYDLSEESNLDIERRYRRALCKAFWDHRARSRRDGAPGVVPLKDIFITRTLRALAPIHEREQDERAGSRSDDGDDDDESVNSRPRPAHRGSLRDALAGRGGASLLVVLGEPGFGKTMLLREYALGLAESDGGPLPVFVPLALCNDRSSAASQGDLTELAAQHWKRHGIEGLRPVIEAGMKAGRVVWLLDGLDEIRELGRRRAIAMMIRALAGAWCGHGNKIVVTSRAEGYHEAPLHAREATHRELASFTNDEVQRTVRAWETALSRTGGAGAEAQSRALLARLRENPALAAVARNPLMLAMLAQQPPSWRGTPQRSADVCSDFVDALLDPCRRERSEGSGVGPGDRDGKHRTLQVLSELALELHLSSPTGEWTRTELARVCERIVLRLDGELRERSTQARIAAREEVDRFLEQVCEVSGIVVERGLGTYGFLHLMVQEFLVGFALAGLPAQSRWELLCPRLHVPRWRQPLLLCAGLLDRRDASDLCERILVAQSDAEMLLHRDLQLAIAILKSQVEVQCEIHLRVLGGCLDLVEPERMVAERRIGHEGLVVLGALGNVAARDRLASLLGGDDTSDVLWALVGRLQGPQLRPLVPDVIGLLGHRFGSTSDAAMHALVECCEDERVWSAVVGRFGSERAQVCEVAARDFAIAARSRAGLVDDLVKLPAKVRRRFVTIYAELVEELDDVRHVVYEALADPDWELRIAAVSGFGRPLKHGSQVARELVLMRVNDPSDWVRFHVATVLVPQWRHPAVSSALERLLRDRCPPVRAKVMEGFGIGDLDPEVLRFVNIGLHDDDDEVKRYAGSLLRSLQFKLPDWRAAVLRSAAGADLQRSDLALSMKVEWFDDKELAEVLLKLFIDPAQPIRDAALFRARKLHRYVPAVRDLLLAAVPQPAALAALVGAVDEPAIRTLLMRSFERSDRTLKDRILLGLRPWVWRDPAVERLFLAVLDLAADSHVCRSIVIPALAEDPRAGSALWDRFMGMVERRGDDGLTHAAYLALRSMADTRTAAGEP